MIGDFNIIPENKKLSDFWEMNKFEHLILKPTCLKGLLPSTIDLLLTNHKRNIPPQGDHLGSKENLC